MSQDTTSVRKKCFWTTQTMGLESPSIHWRPRAQDKHIMLHYTNNCALQSHAPLIKKWTQFLLMWQLNATLLCDMIAKQQTEATSMTLDSKDFLYVVLVFWGVPWDYFARYYQHAQKMPLSNTIAGPWATKHSFLFCAQDKNIMLHETDSFALPLDSRAQRAQCKAMRHW